MHSRDIHFLLFYSIWTLHTCSDPVLFIAALYTVPTLFKIPNCFLYLLFFLEVFNTLRSNFVLERRSLRSLITRNYSFSNTPRFRLKFCLLF